MNHLFSYHFLLLDENYDIKFAGPGTVGMMNSMKPNHNGSIFFIQTGPASYLNGKHTAFGTVVDGWKVIKRIEACGRYDGPKKGIPRHNVKIVNSGVLEE
jgi:cyclophilin family peptidyl-prolyl cis-trans isomerase